MATNNIPTKNLDVVLTKELNKTMYSLAVRTTTDMVFDTEYKYSLTEMLEDISKFLIRNQKSIAGVSEAFDVLMKDAPDEANTLLKIWQYINVDGDGSSKLLQMLRSKQDKEEGKGLSTNDFTDLLYDKLNSAYSKEELDVKFMTVEEKLQTLDAKPTIYITDGTTPPESMKEGDFWYQIIGSEVPYV